MRRTRPWSCSSSGEQSRPLFCSAAFEEPNSQTFNLNLNILTQKRRSVARPTPGTLTDSRPRLHARLGALGHKLATGLVLGAGHTIHCPLVHAREITRAMHPLHATINLLPNRRASARLMMEHLRWMHLLWWMRGLGRMVLA